MWRPIRLTTVLVLLFLVAACSSSDDDSAASTFPTGTFVGPSSSLELNADGTCRWFGGGWELPCKYAVNGDLYTEMWFDWPDYSPEDFFPATYYWDYDGESLTFALWGVDANPSRSSAYAQTLVRSG